MRKKKLRPPASSLPTFTKIVKVGQPPVSRQTIGSVPSVPVFFRIFVPANFLCFVPGFRSEFLEHEALYWTPSITLFSSGTEDRTFKQEAVLDCGAAAAALSGRAELDAIDEINHQFEERYSGRLSRDSTLTRGLVSFQANKSRSVYRWYKFKEAFSADLVEYLLVRHGVKKGVLLDPFAGSGTALFAASGVGLHAEGIELLPIGQRVVETKQLIDSGLSAGDTAALTRWASNAPWRKVKKARPLAELRITKGAYPVETAESMARFLEAINTECDSVRSILTFALLCIGDHKFHQERRAISPLGSSLRQPGGKNLRQGCHTVLRRRDAPKVDRHSI